MAHLDGALLRPPGKQRSLHNFEFETQRGHLPIESRRKIWRDYDSSVAKRLRRAHGCRSKIRSSEFFLRPLLPFWHLKGCVKSALNPGTTGLHARKQSIRASQGTKDEN